MSKLPKHHYIPVFYLQQWTDNRGRLVEYSRQGRHNFVRARPTSPRGTGYVRGLNLVPGASPDVAEFVETQFMRLVDDWASRALITFLSPNREPTLKERVGWARFIYSLILRTPEHIDLIRRKSIDFKVTLPPQALLPELINSVRVIEHITRMAWHVADFSTTSARFITSDRPLIMTNGLASEDSHLALPISPTKIFLAVERHSTFESLKKLDTELVSTSNMMVAQQAVKYVYWTDASRIYFVASHLGKRIRSTPLDDVSEVISGHLRASSKPRKRMFPGSPGRA